MRTRRILFIGMSPNFGGIETFMKNVFSKLTSNGFIFTFVDADNKPLAYSTYIINNGGHILNVSINNKSTGYLTRYWSARHFFAKHHDFDVVHVNALSLTSLFWIKAAYKYGIKNLIIHSHTDTDISYTSKIKRFLANVIIKHNQNYLKRHMSIHELAASKSCGKWMFNNSHFVIVPNGINVNEFKFDYRKRLALKQKLNIDKNDNVIVTVARFDYAKNYPKILNVFKEIHEYKPDTKLVIMGDGPYKKQIFNIIKRLHLNNDVIWLGLINDVYNVLNIGDLMLMPSRYEGFPFSLIESQSSGVPALVSSEAIPKLSNVTGMLKYVSLKSSDYYWAKCGIKMLNNAPDMMTKYKMNNIIRNSRYNIDNSINKVRNIYLK